MGAEAGGGAGGGTWRQRDIQALSSVHMRSKSTTPRESAPVGGPHPAQWEACFQLPAPLRARSAPPQPHPCTSTGAVGRLRAVFPAALTSPGKVAHVSPWTGAIN